MEENKSKEILIKELKFPSDKDMEKKKEEEKIEYVKKYQKEISVDREKFMIYKNDLVELMTLINICIINHISLSQIHKTSNYQLPEYMNKKYKKFNDNNNEYINFKGNHKNLTHKDNKDINENLLSKINVDNIFRGPYPLDSIFLNFKTNIPLIKLTNSKDTVDGKYIEYLFYKDIHPYHSIYNSARQLLHIMIGNKHKLDIRTPKVSIKNEDAYSPSFIKLKDKINIDIEKNKDLLQLSEIFPIIYFYNENFYITDNLKSIINIDDYLKIFNDPNKKDNFEKSINRETPNEYVIDKSHFEDKNEQIDYKYNKNYFDKLTTELDKGKLIIKKSNSYINNILRKIGIKSQTEIPYDDCTISLFKKSPITKENIIDNLKLPYIDKKYNDNFLNILYSVYLYTITIEDGKPKNEKKAIDLTYMKDQQIKSIYNNIQEYCQYLDKTREEVFQDIDNSYLIKNIGKVYNNSDNELDEYIIKKINEFPESIYDFNKFKDQIIKELDEISPILYKDIYNINLGEGKDGTCMIFINDYKDEYKFNDYLIGDINIDGQDYILYGYFDRIFKILSIYALDNSDNKINIAKKYVYDIDGLIDLKNDPLMGIFQKNYDRSLSLSQITEFIKIEQKEFENIFNNTYENINGKKYEDEKIIDIKFSNKILKELKTNSDNKSEFINKDELKYLLRELITDKKSDITDDYLDNYLRDSTNKKKLMKLYKKYNNINFNGINNLKGELFKKISENEKEKYILGADLLIYEKNNNTYYFSLNNKYFIECNIIKNNYYNYYKIKYNTNVDELNDAKSEYNLVYPVSSEYPDGLIKICENTEIKKKRKEIITNNLNNDFTKNLLDNYNNKFNNTVELYRKIVKTFKIINDSKIDLLKLGIYGTTAYVTAGLTGGSIIFAGLLLHKAFKKIDKKSTKLDDSNIEQEINDKDIFNSRNKDIGLLSLRDNYENMMKEIKDLELFDDEDNLYNEYLILTKKISTSISEDNSDNNISYTLKIEINETWDQSARDFLNRLKILSKNILIRTDDSNKIRIGLLHTATDKENRFNNNLIDEYDELLKQFIINNEVTINKSSINKFYNEENLDYANFIIKIYEYLDSKITNRDEIILSNFTSDELKQEIDKFSSSDKIPKYFFIQHYLYFTNKKTTNDDDNIKKGNIIQNYFKYASQLINSDTKFQLYSEIIENYIKIIKLKGFNYICTTDNDFLFKQYPQDIDNYNKGLKYTFSYFIYNYYSTNYSDKSIIDFINNIATKIKIENPEHSEKIKLLYLIILLNGFIIEYFLTRDEYDQSKIQEFQGKLVEYLDNMNTLLTTSDNLFYKNSSGGVLFSPNLLIDNYIVAYIDIIDNRTGGYPSSELKMNAIKGIYKQSQNILLNDNYIGETCKHKDDYSLIKTYFDFLFPRLIKELDSSLSNINDEICSKIIKRLIDFFSNADINTEEKKILFDDIIKKKNELEKYSQNKILKNKDKKDLLNVPVDVYSSSYKEFVIKCCKTELSGSFWYGLNNNPIFNEIKIYNKNYHYFYNYELLEKMKGVDITIYNYFLYIMPLLKYNKIEVEKFMGGIELPSELKEQIKGNSNIKLYFDEMDRIKHINHMFSYSELSNTRYIVPYESILNRSIPTPIEYFRIKNQILGKLKKYYELKVSYDNNLSKYNEFKSKYDKNDVVGSISDIFNKLKEDISKRKDESSKRGDTSSISRSSEASKDNKILEKEKEKLKEKEKEKEKKEDKDIEKDEDKDSIDNVGKQIILNDGNKGIIISVNEDGSYLIRLENGEIVKIGGDKDKLKDLEEELNDLKKNKEINENLIKELYDNIRFYKSNKDGFESELRQKQIILYERKKKELTFIKNAIKNKNEELKIIRLLLEKQNDMHDELRLNNNQQILEDNELNMMKLTMKMKELDSTEKKKKKKYDMKIKEKEINELEIRKENYKYLQEKDKSLRLLDDNDNIIPIYSSKKKKRKTLKKNKKEDKKSEKKKSEKKKSDKKKSDKKKSDKKRSVKKGKNKSFINHLGSSMRSIIN